VWVCSASDPEEGDFSIPAVWTSGSLTLSVSTGGASPALAAALRDTAVQAISPAAAGLVAILAEIRPQVFEQLQIPRVRRRILREWADPRWLVMWSELGADAVRRALMQRIEQAKQW
jgi:siroheme synthase (precorrin-2 oxidase/ferrochelatase)